MFFAAPFNPKTDIPSQGGKVILITGANGGIGKESLRYFATHGGSDVKLYLGARTPSKAQDAIKEIEAEVPGSKIHFLELDLASLASVKKAADTFKAENTQLDILMNNAGVMALPPDLTKDGYEIQFGTNVMGHFLLTRELLPLLQHFHPSVSIFADSLVTQKTMPPKPDPTQHSLMHFLDRFFPLLREGEMSQQHG